MSTAIMEPTSTALQLAGEGGKPTSLAPRNMNEALEFSKLVANSDLAPKDYKGKPGNVLIAIQMGAEVGLAPMQALQNIAVINGRPSLWGDAALAVVMAHPHYESHTETIDGSGDNRAGVFRIKRRGHEVHEARFSVADAKKAQLWGKTGPWTQYPDRMLQLRARGFAIRDKFPDALRGLITTEEAMDYPSEPPARPVQRAQPVTEAATTSEAVTCADCNKPITDFQTDAGATLTAQQVAAFSRKKYDADLCGGCMLQRKNGKATPVVNADSFTETKFDKDGDGSVIATGIVRSCSLTEGPKARLIVKFDDDAEVYSFRTKSTKALIEKHCIGKTCSFLCTDSQHGLTFSNVLTIDGVDAATVEMNGEIVP